jgi:hypothetical protein
MEKVVGKKLGIGKILLRCLQEKSPYSTDISAPLYFSKDFFARVRVKNKEKILVL